MPDNTKKAVRQIRKGVTGTARGSPVIAAGEAIAKVGEKVIEHTPEFIKKYGRRLRREVQSLASGSKGRVRRHQRMRRRSASRR